jgi:type I restriction enzyme, S subunit
MAEVLKPGWRWVRLGDVAVERTERVENPAASEFDRYVGSDDIDRFGWSVRRWRSATEVTSAAKIFHPGDYLFVRRSLYASDFRERAAYADFSGVCSGDILPLREKFGAIESGFLGAVLNHPRIWEYVVKHATGSITRRIKWRDLANYEFALPPLEEQRRVVILRTACWKTEDSLRATLEAASVVRRAMLVELLPTLSGGVPTRLGSLARIVRGSTPRPAGDPRFFNGVDVPWITVGEITRSPSVFLDSTETRLTFEGAERSRLLKCGTVVLSNSGWTLGVPKILRIDGCANDGVAAFLDLDHSILPEFLYWSLARLTHYFRNVVAAGGDQPNLNTAGIAAVEILLPPISLQQTFLSQMSEVQAAEVAAAQRLSALRAMVRSTEAVV